MSKYHTEEMVKIITDGTVKMVPRSRCCRPLHDTETKDGTKVALASDRVYIRAADGSLRSTRTPCTKAEKKQLKRQKREARNARQSQQNG